MQMTADPTEVDPCPMEVLAYEFASVSGRLAAAWEDPENRRLLRMYRHRLITAFDEVWEIEGELSDERAKLAVGV
jgi:hypothetical protein